MPTVPPTTTYGKPRYTTHRNPYGDRPTFRGTNHTRGFLKAHNLDKAHLREHEDIEKQARLERKTARADRARTAAKKGKGGTRRRRGRGTRRR